MTHVGKVQMGGGKAGPGRHSQRILVSCVLLIVHQYPLPDEGCGEFVYSCGMFFPSAFLSTLVKVKGR